MSEKPHCLEEVRLVNDAGKNPVTLSRREFQVLVKSFKSYLDERRRNDELGIEFEEEQRILDKCRRML